MTQAHRRITIKDLATQLGVSTASVSNAFNRPDQLSLKLRERILGEAQRLGYDGPDAKARSLRTGSTRIIAVMLAESLTYSLNDAVSSELLTGIAEVLDAHGRTLMLLSDRQQTSQASGSSSMADGLIAYGLMPSLMLLDELPLPSRRSMVAVDFHIEGYPSVYIDNEPASYDIARHALETPARYPTVVGLRLTAQPCNQRIDEGHELWPDDRTTIQRLQGFYRAFDERGIDPARVPLWNIEENTYEVCAPVIAEILDLPPEQRPDLLLCMSDRIALTALTLAEQRGLRIPEDLRITGFDGIAEGQYRAPRLTTVRQNSIEKGRLAASMILGIAPMKSCRLTSQLIYGDTCP